MADFSDGIKEYIEAAAVITNTFPVDYRGNADISCYQCKYFSRNSGSCQITKEITAYPQRFIGKSCPFKNSSGTKEEK